MSTYDFIAAIAADLNKAKGGADAAAAKYATRLVVAFDSLIANGVNSADGLLNDGEMRTAWRDAIAVAYLTAAELKLYRGTGARKDKNLATEGNKEGQTKRGGICTRVERRAKEIATDIAKMFAAEGATTEAKAEAAKKGANANEARDLKVRIAEELSKLIKAVDKDATKEKPTIKRHGNVKAILDKAASDIAATLK